MTAHLPGLEQPLQANSFIIKNAIIYLALYIKYLIL